MLKLVTSMDFGQKFGQLVRTYREQQGLSLSQLALLLWDDEARRSRVSEIENGKVSKPRASTIHLFMEKLNIPRHEIEKIRDPGTNENRVLKQAEPGSSQEQPIIQMTLDQYEARLRENLAMMQDEFESSMREEKLRLESQISELKKRLDNPEAALEEAKATIKKLEEALNREANEIGASSYKMQNARRALKQGEFSVADNLLEKVEASEHLAVERAARAAYVRGEIAEQEVRWLDAAKHYQRAATLSPSFSHLNQSFDLHLRIGELKVASHIAAELLKIAETEFGPQSPEYGIALSNVANLETEAGNLEAARSHFDDALTITRAALGEDNEKYAMLLNNLANIYLMQGNYEKAEHLLLQSMEIGKATFGEEHSDYAKQLGNLAKVYSAKGEVDKAEPLFLQAIEIDKVTVGQEHPSYAKHLNELALLYGAQNKYSEATAFYLKSLAILISALGTEHPETLRVQKNYERMIAERESKA